MPALKHLSPTSSRAAFGNTPNILLFQEHLQWSIPLIPHQTAWNLPPTPNTDTDFNTPQETQSKMNSLDPILEKGYDLFSHYIEPMLNKNVMDKSITDNLVFMAYYGSVSGISSSFAAKTAIAMGFKVFGTAVTPFVAQFVESVTETHFNHAKTTYHAILSVFDFNEGGTQILYNPLASEDPFDKIDYSNAFQDALDGLSNLTFNKLLSSGIISAVASEFKDFSLEATHLQAYCQGYFCKNWVAYYYKEWIKQEIKQELSLYLGEKKLQDQQEKALSSQVASKPLSLHEIIDNSGETPSLPEPSALNNQSSLMLFSPPLEVCPAVNTMEVVPL